MLPHPDGAYEASLRTCDQRTRLDGSLSTKRLAEGWTGR